MASWLATLLGLAGGVALALVAVQAALPRVMRASPDPQRTLRLAFAGTLVALLPAALLAVVAGGTLGAAWASHTGTAIGTAAAFAAVLLLGTAAGVLVARWRAS